MFYVCAKTGVRSEAGLPIDPEQPYCRIVSSKLMKKKRLSSGVKNKRWREKKEESKAPTGSV